MAGSKKEFLIIFDPTPNDQLFQQVSSQYEAAQSLPPRILVSLLDPDQASGIAMLPGVASVCEGSVPPDVMQKLTPGETLFTAAWTERQRAAPMERPAEGLTWDAPGFEPPDAPKEDQHGG